MITRYRPAVNLVPSAVVCRVERECVRKQDRQVNDVDVTSEMCDDSGFIELLPSLWPYTWGS